jgi:filamentous hemagglutinin family protein
MHPIFSFRVPTPSRSFTILVVGLLLLGLPCLPIASTVHAAAPITSSGLNTQVTLSATPPAGKTQYDITGGTRPGGGPNLFHSFGLFTVPSNNIANFLNDSGLATSNILARITGTNGNNPTLSSIYGTIQTTGFGNANLFLMNPAGFLFGPNATINVGGMMTFTTADSLRLADGVRFNAVPDAAADALLSTAPVAAFGFLSSNPAAINFVGGQLTVAGGTGLALVGGNISLAPDTSVTPNVPSSITAPGRPILLTSVAGPGEVAADTGIPAAGMALGTITLGQGATLSTVGDPSFGDGSGGAVSIRGGQLIATGAKILTNFASGAIGHGGDVTIVTTGSAAFTNSTIDTTTIDPKSALVKGGDAGAVSITASDLTLTTSQIRTGVSGDATAAILSTGAGGAVTLTGSDSVTLTGSGIDTRTSNSNGNAGAVTIIAPTVTLENNSGINTGVRGPLRTTANGGPVTLGGPQTISVSMTNSRINTESFETEGNAGSVTITGQTVAISDNGLGSQTIITSTHHGSNNGPFPTSGNAGDIKISGTNVTFNGADVESVADSSGTFARGGSISVNGAQSILVDNGTVFTTTTVSNGNAGNIQLTSSNVTISGGSNIGSDTFAGGGSGTITVTGTQNISLDSGSIIVTNADPGSQGPAGQIVLNTPHLTITGGSVVADQNFGDRPGGTVTVQGTSGPAQSVLISDPGSGIITNTDMGIGPGGNIVLNAHSVMLQNGGILFAGSNAAGNGGNILVKADSVSITGGAQITSASVIGDSGTPTGNAGNVTIQGLASPAQSVLIDGSGSGIFTDTQGTGAGGNILLNANSVTLQNGGALSASTSGIASTATGGTITVNANQVQLTTGGQILSASTLGVDPLTGNPVIPSGSGGTVAIQGLSGPAASVFIDGAGSGILTNSVGTGAAGNIMLSANTVTLQNSGTLSAATSGTAPSAIGGALTINANQVQLNTGGSITVSTTGAGAGGSITIGAGSTFASNAGTVNSTATQATGGGINIMVGQSVTLTNGASISASSTGAGNAGNIMINAGQSFLATNSSVTTQASHASGGTIKITTTPSGTVELINSTISASVLDGTGGGGSVNIDPQFVILQNSQILANAVQGPGGNITITTNLLLPDANSVISASSQFGVNGTVTVQSPNAPATGRIIPLSQKPLTATALLSQRCAALASGEFSSFTVAGRDSLPAEPGGWLASPLALATSSGGTGLEARGEGEGPSRLSGSSGLSHFFGSNNETNQIDQTNQIYQTNQTVLSLRQIAPPGFLTQAFAVDWSAGCTS